MSKTKTGGPAFPSGKSEVKGFENSLPYYEGMTLRDWFAGQAMASGAINANSYVNDAKACYAFADAMIAARDA